MACKSWFATAILSGETELALDTIRVKPVVYVAVAWTVDVPAFHPGGPDSIPCRARNFNFYPGTGCVSFICVLSCVVSGGGPDIVHNCAFV